MSKDFIIWEEAHHASKSRWERFWRERLGPALQSYASGKKNLGQALREQRRWRMVDNAIEANIRRAAPPEQLPQFSAQLQRERMRKAQEGTWPEQS